MKHCSKYLITLLVACFIGAAAVNAQAWQHRSASVALKAGESAEISDLYWVINCKSVLTKPPEATIISGPPGVSVSVKDAQMCCRDLSNAPDP